MPRFSVQWHLINQLNYNQVYSAGIHGNLDYIDNLRMHLFLTSIFSYNVESLLLLLSPKLVCPCSSPEAVYLYTYLEKSCTVVLYLGVIFDPACYINVIIFYGSFCGLFFSLDCMSWRSVHVVTED